MPIALDPKATFDYVLEDDRSIPKEDQTVFTLRGLTVAEEAKVADSMISSIPGEEELSFGSGCVDGKPSSHLTGRKCRLRQGAEPRVM
jgi:hypothetical protein